MDNCSRLRYYISYSGVSLPLNLVNEIDEDVEQRITYFTGYYNQSDQLQKIEKMVYGEIELTHEYSYDDSGKLIQAVILEPDDDPRTLIFDEQGQASESC